MTCFPVNPWYITLAFDPRIKFFAVLDILVDIFNDSFGDPPLRERGKDLGNKIFEREILDYIREFISE